MGKGLFKILIIMKSFASYVTTLALIIVLFFFVFFVGILFLFIRLTFPFGLLLRGAHQCSFLLLVEYVLVLTFFEIMTISCPSR